jgi:hypothetical protein
MCTEPLDPGAIVVVNNRAAAENHRFSTSSRLLGALARLGLEEAG